MSSDYDRGYRAGYEAALADCMMVMRVEREQAQKRKGFTRRPK